MNIKIIFLYFFFTVNSYGANWQFADGGEEDPGKLTIYFLDLESVTAKIDKKVSFWIKGFTLETLNQLIKDEKVVVKIAPSLKSKMHGNYKPNLFFIKEYQESFAKTFENNQIPSKEDAILIAIVGELIVNQINIHGGIMRNVEIDCSKNLFKLNQEIHYNQDGSIKSLTITPMPWVAFPPESKPFYWSKLVCG